MNEVNMLNIGGVDYNIDDQHVRDLIAHSENGLDSQSNLPISSRHYDEGEYLIGQDRYYYEATTDIDPGDVLAEGTNLRKTLLSDEIVALKNQSSIAVIQCIAKRETGALATSSYPIIGSYLYWDYGLTAGLYETIAAITAGDALTIGVNLKPASKIADTMDGLQDSYNITGAKNLCPNEASDTTTTDITWDVLSDGSIQVSGTAASNRNLKLAESAILPAGTYKLTTGQADEENALVILHVNRRSDDVVLARSNGASGTPAIFTLQTETTVRFYLTAFKNTTGTAVNVRIFPMCRVASITDDTYVPYAMTNRDLTTRINNLKVKTYSPADIGVGALSGGWVTINKYGDVVTIQFNSGASFSAAAKTWTKVHTGTFPAGFRPKMTFTNLSVNDSKLTDIGVYTRYYSSGEISVWFPAAVSNNLIVGAATFVVDNGT